jgi:serine/threonine protein kinase
MLETGDVLVDRYRIESVLGHGGMGSVYQATDLRTHTQVAVKEMLPDPQTHDSAALVEQFRVEGQMLRALSHRGLPKLYDVFSLETCHYMVMELIIGTTLDHLPSEYRPDEHQALTWALAIAEVLDYLHKQTPPIIFRDIKPGNIMIESSGSVKLIDFGIAKRFDPRSMTKTVIRGAGSPGYAPPEQYFGYTDARTDLYALGATLFGLLAWQAPPESLDVMNGAVRMVRVRSIDPTISVETDELVSDLLQTKRENRPPSAARVVERMRSILDPSMPLPAERSDGPATMPRHLPGHSRAFVPALVGVVVAIAVVAACMAVPAVRSKVSRWFHVGPSASPSPLRTTR